MDWFLYDNGLHNERVYVSLFVLVEHLGTTDEIFPLTISLVIVSAESCRFIHIYWRNL